MQFRARLAAVGGTAPRSEDAPNRITVKLEPMSIARSGMVIRATG